ncbi:MAG: DUF2510 domain-containing protein, partial [Gemmatimonadales bacterium]
MAVAEDDVSRDDGSGGTPPPTTVAPSWYLDPASGSYLRWWDGYRWSELTRPLEHAGSGRQRRRWLALQLCAGATFLAGPCDFAILNWVSDASSTKAECSTPLPAYQATTATLIPAAFVVLGLA